MQLEFKKQNGLYEVEFEVTGDFNLHLERKNYGRVELYQKTSSETNYTSSPSYSANSDAIINLDFSMGVYPKFVKIISYTEVEKAIVTMDGEGGNTGSSSSGGLRPITADDVILYKTNQFGEEELPFSNIIVVPENNGFSMKIKDTKKSLFFTGETAVLIKSFENGELYSIGSFEQETTINIEDVYIKD